MARRYRLGRRQGAVDRTRLAILTAARELVASGEAGLSAGAVARRAGVSRITVYNQFGSKAGLLNELARDAHSRPAAGAPDPTDPLAELRRRIADSCSMWASDAALFRRLPRMGTLELASPHDDRALAERLAAADRLRPGCSLKEAEDVIGAITAFTVFDRLHKDGRRSSGAVGEILMRLASTILDGQATPHSQ
ncbi:MAG TPA: helix-turn-helix domain-containing protein [Candidatus Dormibacteraeota bacterium]|jgi:AcrR family transcriptional regulator